MSRIFRKRPARLFRVFECYQPPLYFVTVCTRNRNKILDNPGVHEAFLDYASRAVERQCAVGKYVIMPDHIHLFVRISGEVPLSQFVRLLKQRLTFHLKPKAGQASFWQPGFFDHLLRSSESYSQKWIYVCQNPVRAKLVTCQGNWPYQGEIVRIDRV
ncbi:MAG: transposase [Kiritimatiellia bacterium]